MMYRWECVQVMQCGVRGLCVQIQADHNPPSCMSQVHPDLSNVRNLALAVTSDSHNCGAMHRYLLPRSADHSPNDHPAKRQRTQHAHVSDAAPAVRQVWRTL
jgi:hypothetical protein